MLAVAETVRHVEVEGCRIILDLRTGQYRVLDPIASVMWHVFTGASQEASAVTALSLNYDTPPERIVGDLNNFTETCLAEGLLATDGPPTHPVADQGSPASPKASHRPSWPRALGELIWTNRMLSRPRGFAKVYALCAQLPMRAGPSPLDRAVAAFIRAENLYWARRAPDDCLGRSLALYRFLCECGIECRHVIGVSRIPFRAHAWVECGGEALLDRRGLSTSPIAVMAPRG